jgi:hypothetical protein
VCRDHAPAALVQFLRNWAKAYELGNVPLTGGPRYGEIVVHDGEPKGERIYEGVTYPVFDKLLLFEARTVSRTSPDPSGRSAGTPSRCRS